MPAPCRDLKEGLVLCKGAVLCLGLLAASCCSHTSQAVNVSDPVTLGARRFQKCNVLPVLWSGAEECTRAPKYCFMSNFRSSNTAFSSLKLLETFPLGMSLLLLIPRKQTA